ncbi:hypothetical protein ILYODFUR_036834 [Ilyodon furcidens]|uniref:Uncharacterized protein n=1 Tax=Ilyodon furcidens TaxID=33524 RepID=A0ABV0V027_9TELE
MIGARTNCTGARAPVGPCLEPPMTGTTQEVFHRRGTFSRLRLRLYMWLRTSQNWSAQVFSSLGLMSSGPASFFYFSRLSSSLTWSDVRERGELGVTGVHCWGLLLAGVGYVFVFFGMFF